MEMVYSKFQHIFFNEIFKVDFDDYITEINFKTKLNLKS